jgi:hypothetical protein
VEVYEIAAVVVVVVVVAAAEHKIRSASQKTDGPIVGVLIAGKLSEVDLTKDELIAEGGKC